MSWLMFWLVKVVEVLSCNTLIERKHMERERKEGIEEVFLAWDEQKTETLHEWTVATLKLRNLGVPLGDLIKIMLLNFKMGPLESEEVEQ